MHKSNKNHKIILVIFIFIHLILLILTLTGKLNFLFNDASLRKGKGSDFFAVYQAGNNLINNKSIYEDTEGISTLYSFPYRYLPFLGYSLGVFFNIFSPFTAYAIFILLNEIILFINIFLIFKLSKNNFTLFLISIIPLLFFTPYLIEIYMGQWSFILGSLLFYCIYGLINKSKLSHLYILSPLVKPNALILVPMLIRFKKIKLLIITLIGIIFTSLPYFMFYKSDLLVFIQNFKDSWYSHGGNLGFKSLYYLVAIKYLNIPSPRIWFYLFLLLIILISLYLTFKYKNIILSYVIWISVYFLIYKDVWEHHYVLLMPIYSLIIIRYKLYLKKIVKRNNILLLISFILIALPSLFSLQYIFIRNAPIEPDSLSPMFVIPYHSIKVIGIFLLYLWSIKKITKEN